MSNYGKGFFASLCVHLLLFSALYAFAHMAVKETDGLVVDISLIGLAGSGSGRPDAGGGEAGAAGRIAENAAPEPAGEAGPEPVEPAPVPKPVTAQTPLLPDPEAAPLPGKPEKKPEPQKEPKPKTRKGEAKTAAKQPTAAPADSPGSVMPRASVSGPGAPGNPGPGNAPGAYGAGGGTSNGSGGGPRGGTGGGSNSGYVKANYDYIQRYIGKHLRYPNQARMMNQTGVARYSFVIEKNGEVSDIRLLESCGFSLLDKAGAKAIRDASPLPAPPEPARIEMPISFLLR